MDSLIPEKPKTSISVTRHFNVPAERVFDAWLDTKTVGKWLFATPTGEMVRVEIDPRVSGAYVITEKRDGEEVEHTGHYLEIDRPRRLAFSFKVPKYSNDATKVTLDIKPAGQGCALTLTHEGVWQDWADRTKQGWDMILDGLAGVLG